MPWHSSFAACCIALWSALAAGDEISRATVVRFNTVCAVCHEGECSGRLSYSGGAGAARGHMQRYLGKLGEDEAAALFDLLRYTKERCAPYPVATRIPDGGVWRTADLAPWRNPREGGYYIPLGELRGGAYRLRLAFAGTAAGRLKITDDHFEVAGEEALRPERTQDVVFRATSGPHYLTLLGTAELAGLRLEAVAP